MMSLRSNQDKYNITYQLTHFATTTILPLVTE